MYKYTAQKYIIKQKKNSKSNSEMHYLGALDFQNKIIWCNFSQSRMFICILKVRKLQRQQLLIQLPQTKNDKPLYGHHTIKEPFTVWRHNIIRIGPQWKWDHCTTQVDSGALSPSSINGWVNKKDFHQGAAECEPTQWNAWRLVRAFQTTCSSTAQLVRLHETLPGAQPMPNSMISDPLARLDKQIWKISPWKPQTPECHANPSPERELHGQLLEKATLARIMLNYLTKILLILDRRRAYLTVLTELELCTNNLPLADRCMLNFFFYWTHSLQLQLVY